MLLGSTEVTSIYKTFPIIGNLSAGPNDFCFVLYKLLGLVLGYSCTTPLCNKEILSKINEN